MANSYKHSQGEGVKETHKRKSWSRPLFIKWEVLSQVSWATTWCLHVEMRGNKLPVSNRVCLSDCVMKMVHSICLNRRVDDGMNITRELLKLHSLNGQTRWVDLSDSVCSADMKLPWSKVSRSQGGNAVQLHCTIHQQVFGSKCLKSNHVVKPDYETKDY